MKNKSIQAIPTYYNGNKFRSRIEARWATFLDFWNIPYIYEQDGYKRLDDGLCYLPDFRVSPPYLQEIDPQAGFWLEIKPSWPPTPQECEKAIMLALGKDEPVVMIGGDIWPGRYKAVVYLPDFERYKYPDLPPQVHEEIAIKCAKENGAHFISPTKFIYFNEEWDELSRLEDARRGFTCSYITFCFCPFCKMLVLRRWLSSFECPRCKSEMVFTSPSPYNHPFLEEGFKYAHQAKFEHGENPIKYFCVSCPIRDKDVYRALKQRGQSSYNNFKEPRKYD